MTKKVIELIRVSTERQAADDRASIPAQRDVNRRTCLHYGLEIATSIEFSDVSGASVLLAPEITRLMRLMQSPDVHGVVTREFSRLMRPENLGDFALLQAFVDSKTILYLPDGPIDLSSKSGRLVGTIRAVIAGNERIEILERVWTAKEEKRRRGELAQGTMVLGFGVGYDKGQGFFYKPEAERVREAIRQFLAGNQSYRQLAHLVGVTPRGLHIILRNPIWTGWRVIDKKRDMSSGGRYASLDGRQADRRKIARDADEIIRVQVIDEPLISKADFESLQRIMDLKQSKHWRSQPQIERRFIFNGFLTCSECGETIHTALARRDYYACKGRRSSHVCKTRYMGREKLETVLDELLTKKLTNASFVGDCVSEAMSRLDKDDSALQIKRLTSEVENLREKRNRVVDSFIEGVIGRQERDERLVGIDRGIQTTQDILIRKSPAAAAFDSKKLIEAFAPLFEWKFWIREQKRAVLSALTPDIRVANYQVDALGLSAAIFSNEDTRMDRGSSPPPA